MALNLADIFVSKNQNQGTADFSTAKEAGAGLQGAADTLLNIFGRGADIYTQVKGGGTIVPAGVNANVPVANTSQTVGGGRSLTPWILGGVALLLVAFLVFRK